MTTKLSTACYKNADAELPNIDGAKCLIWHPYHKIDSPIRGVWSTSLGYWSVPEPELRMFPGEVDYWAYLNYE